MPSISHKFNWKESNLTQICDISKSGIKKFEGSKFYVDTGDLIEYVISDKKPVKYNTRPTRANMQTEIDDILMARMKKTKKIFHITENEKNYLFSTGFAVLKPNKQKIFPKYLFHYLLTDKFQNIKDLHCSGSTQKAINNNNFKNITIIHPEFIQDQEIISFKLDKLLELRNNARACNKIYSDFILSTFFKIFDRTKRKNWTKMSLKKIIMGKPQNGLFKKNNLYGDGTKIAWVANITSLCILDDFNLKRVPLTNAEKNKFKVDVDDILVTRSSHLGVSGVGVMNVIPSLTEDITFESHIMKIKINKELASPYYICAYFQTQEGRNKIIQKTRGATMASINQPSLLNIDVELPPIEQQLKFESIIKKSNSVTKKLSKLQKEVDFFFKSVQNASFN